MARINTKAFVNLRRKMQAAALLRDDRLKRGIGNAVVALMRDFIAKGISPIDKAGRFPGYKNAGKKRGYPYNTRQYKNGSKRLRPVNLFLTGAFLKAIRLVSVSATGFYIGFLDSDKKNRVKEEGHRLGTNRQPKRPIIPSNSERFNATIRLEIQKRMRDAVQAKLREGR